MGRANTAVVGHTHFEARHKCPGIRASLGRFDKRNYFLKPLLYFKKKLQQYLEIYGMLAAPLCQYGAAGLDREPALGSIRAGSGGKR